MQKYCSDPPKQTLGLTTQRALLAPELKCVHSHGGRQPGGPVRNAIRNAFLAWFYPQINKETLSKLQLKQHSLLLCLCTYLTLCQWRQGLDSHKQVTEEHRFDLGHKMSTLMDSKTNSRRVLVSSMGLGKWKKISTSQVQKLCRGRAGSSVRCIEKRDADGEGRGDGQQEVLDNCFSLA